MDCLKAQEDILESLVVPLTNKQQERLAGHIAVCVPCRDFQQLHAGIDRRLTAAIPGVSLSPHFHALIQETIRRDPLRVWPDFLPDLAHIIGCVTAIMLSFTFLPWGSRTILLAGFAFTVFTHFLQVVVLSYLEKSADF